MNRLKALILGIHEQRGRLNVHLLGITNNAKIFLESQGVQRNTVPLYLMATGGLRSQGQDPAVRDEILHDAFEAMRGLDFFRLVSQARNANYIKGEVEGLYGWVALNYGRVRTADDHFPGLLELGGASMQIARKDPTIPATAPLAAFPDRYKVCLVSGDHVVYSKTWDGFGAKDTREKMRAAILRDAGIDPTPNHLPNAPITYGRIIPHPCLPRGQDGGEFLTAPNAGHKLVGNADFETCLLKARAVLNADAGRLGALPQYQDIELYTNRFFGVSNFWYTFEFFSRWGAYDPHAAYDRDLFTKAVKKYCTGSWTAIPWAENNRGKEDGFQDTRCFSAAWMLTVLHDKKPAFGLKMTKYDTDKGVLRFPITEDQASRSSWTIGAAALIARDVAGHGYVGGTPRFCRGLGADPSDPPNFNANVNSTVETQALPPITYIPSPVHPSLIGQPNSSLPSVRAGFDLNIHNPFITSPAGLAYGILLFVFVILGYRRLRAPRPSPIVLEEKGVVISEVAPQPYSLLARMQRGRRALSGIIPSVLVVDGETGSKGTIYLPTEEQNSSPA